MRLRSFGMMQQLVCLLPSCRSGLATVRSANTSKEKSNGIMAMDRVVQCSLAEHVDKFFETLPGRKGT